MTTPELLGTISATLAHHSYPEPTWVFVCSFYHEHPRKNIAWTKGEIPFQLRHFHLQVFLGVCGGRSEIQSLLGMHGPPSLSSTEELCKVPHLTPHHKLAICPALFAKKRQWKCIPLTKHTTGKKQMWNDRKKGKINISWCSFSDWQIFNRSENSVLLPCSFNLPGK